MKKTLLQTFYLTTVTVAFMTVMKLEIFEWTSGYFLLLIFGYFLWVCWFLTQYKEKHIKNNHSTQLPYQKSNLPTENEKYHNDFLGNVAHEMKTPLFNIQGYILTLLDGAWKDPIICKKYLKNAALGVERLEAVVKDLDLINQLQKEKLERLSFDMVTLVKNTFQILELTALKKEINLNFTKNYEFPKYVFADPKKIEQVLVNLISNGIKYGKIKGNVWVCLTEEKKN